MKKVFAALVAGAAVAAPVAPAAAGAAPSKNIVQIAAGDPKDFSTLVSLVKKAGLAGALSTKTVTVFAPTNAAFAKVPKATLAKLGRDRALLAKVLEYHVLPGVVPASKVLSEKSAATLIGEKVRFSVRGGKPYVNDAQIVKTNIRARNGIIHVINAVLIP